MPLQVYQTSLVHQERVPIFQFWYPSEAIKMNGLHCSGKVLRSKLKYVIVSDRAVGNLFSLNGVDQRAVKAGVKLSQHL